MSPVAILGAWASIVAAAPSADEAAVLQRAQELEDTAFELRAQDRLKEAADAALESLELRLHQAGPDAAVVAESYDALGMVRESQGHFDEAQAAYQSAHDIRLAALGPDHVRFGWSLYLLGALARQLGDYDRAMELSDRSLAIRAAALGEDDQDLAINYNERAMILEDIGRYDEAEDAYLRALELTKALETVPDVSFAALLNNIAYLRHLQHDIVGAMEVHRRALALREGALGRRSGDVAESLSNIAILLVDMGDYAGARAHLEEALSIREEVLGPDHPDVASALHNLASVLRRLGLDEAAAALLRRALTILEERLGVDHPYTSATLGSLAQLEHAAGRSEHAVELLEQAIARSVASRGPAHPEVATATNNLARMLADLGRFEEARARYESALEAFEGALGPDHPLVARTQGNLCDLTADQGELDRALALCTDTVRRLEASLGPDHPDTLRWVRGRGDVLELLDPDAPELRAVRSRVLDTTAAQLGDSLGSLSEREALKHIAALARVVADHLRAFSRPGDEVAAWNAVVRWKGLVARTVTARQARARSDPAQADRVAELSAARQRAATLLVASLRTGERLDTEAIVEARERAGLLERELAATSDALRGDLLVRDAVAADLCAGLPRRSALVDFLHYRGASGEPSYLAFVVTPACEVTRVELGPAAAIDAAIASHRAALATRDEQGLPGLTRRIDERGARLYDAVWRDLAPWLRGAERVVLVPDGALAEVAFGSLPGPDGAYVVEHHRLAYLESAADLLRHREAPAGPGTALVVGNVDYGVAPPPTQLAGRSATCFEQTYAPLPGTGTEAEAVAGHWRERGIRVERIEAAQADEASVVGALGRSRFVHLATHGFFADSSCRSALGSERGVGVDPMVLSGIVLAKANEPTDPWAAWDGLLTAAEVSALDLRHIQLVVLSACETGRGEAMTGQGVLGLRRAFTAAGAQTLVMSLWGVSDAATAELMDALYGSIQRRRRARDPAEALRQAQLKMLSRNRKRYGEARPSDWAAFVAAGWTEGR